MSDDPVTPREVIMRAISTPMNVVLDGYAPLCVRIRYADGIVSESGTP